MFKLLGNKRLLLILFSLILFIAIMGITFIKRESPTWPEKFLSDSTAWIQGLFYKPASSVAGFFEDLSQIEKLYEENQVLKQTLAHYARDVAKLNTLEEENERLKSALNFTERQKMQDDYTYHIARVVSVSPDVNNSLIQIDLGEKDGIKENMAVTTVDGLIGIVTRVKPFYSSVQLLTDLNSQSTMTKAVAATVRGQDSFGIIESYDAEEGVLLMTKIKQEDPLVEENIVVTSGLGGIYPEGITIGEVISREVGEFGLTYTAKIKPAAKFDHLREVFVIEVPFIEDEDE